MAPVIWGLDLAEIKWSKFKSSYMWNTEYHLRRTKFIVYQCALIFCVVSESLGTAALSDYVDSQRYVKALDRNVYVYNNDYIGIASYNIFAGVFVAFIFGAAFFFDLFWPERHESTGVLLAWRICGVLAVIFHLAAALALTEITAVHCGYFKGADQEYGESLLNRFTKDGGTPLCYRHNSRAVAAVVFDWVGWVSVLGSCILLFYSINHNQKLGPKSTHARQRDLTSAEKGDSSETEKEDSVAAPEPAHARSEEPVVDAPAAERVSTAHAAVDAGQATTKRSYIEDGRTQ